MLIPNVNPSRTPEEVVREQYLNDLLDLTIFHKKNGQKSAYNDISLLEECFADDRQKAIDCFSVYYKDVLSCPPEVIRFYEEFLVQKKVQPPLPRVHKPQPVFTPIPSKRRLQAAE